MTISLTEPFRVNQACRRVNAQGGFAPKYGGGQIVPAFVILGAAMTAMQGEAFADEFARTSEDYINHYMREEDVTLDAALLRNQLNSLYPLAGELAFPYLLK